MFDTQILRVRMSKTMFVRHLGVVVNRGIFRIALFSVLCLFLTLGAGHLRGESESPLEKTHISYHPVLNWDTKTPDANSEPDEIQENLNCTIIKWKKIFPKYISPLEYYTTLNYHIILSEKCNIRHMSLSLLLRTMTPTILLA